LIPRFESSRQWNSTSSTTGFLPRVLGSEPDIPLSLTQTWTRQKYSQRQCLYEALSDTSATVEDSRRQCLAKTVSLLTDTSATVRDSQRQCLARPCLAKTERLAKTLSDTSSTVGATVCVTGFVCVWYSGTQELSQNARLSPGRVDCDWNLKFKEGGRGCVYRETKQIVNTTGSGEGLYSCV